MKTTKVASTAAVLVLLLAALIIGCGSDYTDFEHNAPDGAVIVVSPDTVDISAGDGVVVQPFSVVVRDSSDQPLNGIKVIITGGFAYPFVPSLYSFFDKNGNQKASGFTGVTDAAGVYNFTISIPVTAISSTGSPFFNSFTDEIEVRSGTAFGTAEVKFNNQ